jgi:hypothetical protein
MSDDFKEYKCRGAIEAASFGIGGYNDTALGVTFVLGNGSWAVRDFWGQVSRETAHIISLESALGVVQLLKDSGVTRIEDLVGTPIEITLTGIGGKLKSWRVVKAEKTLEEKFYELYRKRSTNPNLFKDLAQIAKDHYEKEYKEDEE